MSGRGPTSAALEALLAALGPDAESAAAAYERIRDRLTRLFQWRGCREPEALVDETFDRVARRLEGGLEIHSEDPYRYFVGVAHRVFHEILRAEARERRALRDLRHQPEPRTLDDADRLRLDCLDRCLAELGDDRRWILRFYRGEKGEKIRNRKALAEELGITANALRIRAHRLRARLETCVRGCIRRRTAGETNSHSDPPRDGR